MILSDKIYKKLKKQKGEKFAQNLRNFHNGLLEIPDIDRIVKHAGRDVEPLLPYLMGLLAANDDNPPPPPVPQDPFALLEQAGYDAFYADTLQKQNSIKKYFARDEHLCTFDDDSRFEKYHIVHAVKKDADTIKRKNFKGNEQRQDEYGTSVISIQMLKKGGFISIKNRYNHTVAACDNTFDSNPDNIIEGLSVALRERFDVEFLASKFRLPNKFGLVGTQVFKYHTERNNIYYGDQAYAKDGEVKTIDRSVGNVLFEGFLFDNKSKTLKKIDKSDPDSFVDDFNRDYGGNRNLSIDKKGNLTLDGMILIGTDESRIKTINLPALTTMRDNSLLSLHFLETFTAPALRTMGETCLKYAESLKSFIAPALTMMKDKSLYQVDRLEELELPSLTTMGSGCFYGAYSLTEFEAPSLIEMGDSCLLAVNALERVEVPSLIKMEDDCFCNCEVLETVIAPSLTTMGHSCFASSFSMSQFEAPLLKATGESCLYGLPTFLQMKVRSQLACNKYIKPGVTALSSLFNLSSGQKEAAQPLHDQDDVPARAHAAPLNHPRP